MEVHVEDLLNCYSQTKNNDEIKKDIDNLINPLSDSELNQLLIECRNKFSDTYKDLISALNTELTELTKYVDKYDTERYKYEVKINDKTEKESAADYLARLNTYKNHFDSYINDDFSKEKTGVRKARIKTILEKVKNENHVRKEAMDKIDFSKELRGSNIFKKLHMLVSKKTNGLTHKINIIRKSNKSQTWDKKGNAFIYKTINNNNNNSLNTVNPEQKQNVSNINESLVHRNYRNCYINRQHKFSVPTPVKLEDTSIIDPRALETEYESVNPAADESLYQQDPERIDSAAYSEEHSETLKRNNEGKKMASRDKSYPASTSITANGNSMKQRNSTHSLN